MKIAMMDFEKIGKKDYVVNVQIDVKYAKDLMMAIALNVMK